MICNTDAVLPLTLSPRPLPYNWLKYNFCFKYKTSSHNFNRQLYPGMVTLAVSLEGLGDVVEAKEAGGQGDIWEGTGEMKEEEDDFVNAQSFRMLSYLDHL